MVKDFLENLVIVICAFAAFRVWRYRRSRWTVEMYFRNPKSGIVSKKRTNGKKYRYYISVFRVPEKIFDLFD